MQAASCGVGSKALAPWLCSVLMHTLMSRVTDLMTVCKTSVMRILMAQTFASKIPQMCYYILGLRRRLPCQGWILTAQRAPGLGGGGERKGRGGGEEGRGGARGRLRQRGGMAGLINFEDEEEVREYLANLHVEYSYQCFKEKDPEGKRLQGDPGPRGPAAAR